MNVSVLLAVKILLAQQYWSILHFEHPVFSNVGPTYEELTQFVIVLLENLLSFIKDCAT